MAGWTPRLATGGVEMAPAELARGREPAGIKAPGAWSGSADAAERAVSAEPGERVEQVASPPTPEHQTQPWYAQRASTSRTATFTEPSSTPGTRRPSPICATRPRRCVAPDH